jgi:two-component system, chemotaxis family, chemotaxis protein CheY
MTRILVVDDDAASRAALTRLFTQSGYDVRTAADGSEGLRCMVEILPDVLLVDIFMPERDGIETIRLVRRAFPQVPIMAMSGGIAHHEAGDVLTAARDFGAQYTFTKPFAPEVLLAALRTILGTESV